MSSRLKMRVLAALAPAGLAAALAVVALPATSSATPSGTQTLSTSLNLSCVVDPGPTSAFFNAATVLPATITATAPISVNQGDALTLTNVSMSLTVPGSLTTDFAVLGVTKATGTLNTFVLDVSGSSTPTVNAAAGVLNFGPSAIVGGQPVSAEIPPSGPFTLALGTVTGAAGSSVAISVDPAVGFTGPDSSAYYAATGAGIVASVTASSASGSLPSEPVDCSAPPSTTLGSIAVAAAPTTTTSTSTSPTTTTTSATTTTTSSSTSTQASTSSTSQSTSTSQQTTTSSSTTTGAGGVSGVHTIIPPTALTQAQKLAAAIKACAKQKTAKKRAACVAAAKKKYPLPTAPAKPKKKRK